MTDHVLIDVADGVATLTMNRPDTRNALSHEMRAAMADFLAANHFSLINFRLSENDKAFASVGDNTMHLERWQRLEQRMEILTERGLGIDIMLYTDDMMYFGTLMATSDGCCPRPRSLVTHGSHPMTPCTYG